MAIVLISPDAQSQFDDLPRAVQARLGRVFFRLEDWPNVSGAKPLRGDLAGHFRIRTGDYRVQFRIEHDDNEVEPDMPPIVIVEKVGHRDGFYDE